MSEEPTVTLKPIGVKLLTASFYRGMGKMEGKTDECDNLCSGLTHVAV